ncbi:MAG TPA: hypothetical protein VMF69_28340 [Gemmataceae bacterium]|nr:hypothetical protein [Gemmataceae bacterium]
MGSKRNCPECHLIFEAELPETGVLVCPLCNSAFAALSPASPAPAATVLPSNATGRQVWRGVVAVAAVFLLAGGFGYAYHLLSGIGRKPAVAAAPAASATSTPPAPCPVEIIPVIPIEPRPPAPIQQPRPPKLQPTAITKEAQRPLTLAERVNRAIDEGLANMRKNHKDFPQYRNYLGLLGLTLLECGVAADDPSVQQIAGWFRARESDLKQTYDLTLAILFLDRLGDPRDQPLIRTFGNRLLDGRFVNGTWTYACRDRNRADKRLNAYLIKGCGDNSNTQFALLGLWVAQRHGVLSHSAFSAADHNFRASQLSDGGWRYHPGIPRVMYRDSMTCAGLMILAMRYGVSGGQGSDIRPDHPIPVYDGAINRGLRYLAQSLDKISVADGRIIGVEAMDPLYFLWSLERMAVIYDLKKIGRHEWYPWAAEMLVETQQPDGRWLAYMDPVGTCFALLILKRSNLAKDLQLAVQEQPAPPMPDIAGPNILQGPDVFLRRNDKPKQPASLPGIIVRPGPPAPLGPSISRTPNDK